MCGIAGIFAQDRRGVINENHLFEMARMLTHRGPDDSGGFVSGGVGFGFRRLSIVDLAAGNQPHYNEDSSIVSICNGEIYNFKELRRELELKGHAFRTKCDVEILVHLYEESGPAFVSRLNGQFAFALYDHRRHELFLARDPVGIAPLFYTVKGDQLLFASEIKALLRHPSVPRKVNLTGLDQIVTFPGVVSPTTMFEGIHALKPGHYLRAGTGVVETREYWDLIYPEDDGSTDGRPASFYTERLESLLLDAVAQRLDADVPVGFYLSGGLDSSLIGSLIHVARPQQRYHSFSITFPQSEIDERRFQRMMANHLGSIHHEIEFQSEDIIRRLKAAILCAETPLKESYNTCSLALSGLVRETGLKVVLTGEGADELFAGYVGYRFDQTGARRGSGETELEEILENEMRQHLWGDSRLFYEHEYHRFGEIKAGIYSEAMTARLPDFDCIREPLIDQSKLHRRHPLHQRSYLDFKLRLSDHLLADHGDRVAYANSVEARYPFLDLNVLEFARSIPPALLIQNATEKYVLRAIGRKYLPPPVLAREKFGFVAPSTPYLLAQNVEWINDLLSPETIRRQGYFNPVTIERLRAHYRKDGTNINTTFETDLLMIVLTFGIFLETFNMPAYAG